MVAAAVFAAAALAACSSGGSAAKDHDTGAATVRAANAVCTAGKARTAKIVPGVSVVPDPKTPAQRSATRAWASATAADFDRTATALRGVEASGDRAEEVIALAKLYAAAADQLRSDPGAVLGEPDFLADPVLFDAGYHACVAPGKALTTTTTKP
jgi:hypothetical protein